MELWLHETPHVADGATEMLDIQTVQMISEQSRDAVTPLTASCLQSAEQPDCELVDRLAH